MPTLLQAAQALEAAQATHEKMKTAATLAAVMNAHDAHIEAAAKAGSDVAAAVNAKIISKEKYEKVTTEVPEKDPPESKPESSAPPTVDSSAPAKKGKKKAEVEEDEEDEEDAKKAKDKDAEEKALLAAYSSADDAYTKTARKEAVDAYGYKGPAALLKAVQKAFGVKTLDQAFAALAEAPHKLQNTKELNARIAALEETNRKNEISALVERAKAEGRTRGKDDRADLRSYGAKFGAEALKVRIADREPKRTTAQGYLQPKEDATGNRGTVGPEVDHSAITASMTAEQKKVYLEEFAKAQAKNKPAAPAV